MPDNSATTFISFVMLMWVIFTVYAVVAVIIEKYCSVTPDQRPVPIEEDDNELLTCADAASHSSREGKSNGNSNR